MAGFLKQLGMPRSNFSWDEQTHTLSFKPCSQTLAGQVPPSAYLPEAVAQVR
jgi:hypothetical protein